MLDICHLQSLCPVAGPDTYIGLTSSMRSLVTSSEHLQYTRLTSSMRSLVRSSEHLQSY